MKLKLLLGLTAVALTSGTLRAATITYTLVKDSFDGKTVSTGSYAVLASVSKTDNRGLAAYTFELANIASIAERSPLANFSDGDGGNRAAGFSFAFDATTANSVSATQYTLSSNGVLAFGVGQVAGDLNDLKPAGYLPATGSRLVYDANALIARGTYTGAGPSFVAASGNVFSNLVGGVAPTPLTEAGTIVLANSTLPEPASLSAIGLAGMVVVRRRRTVA